MSGLGDGAPGALLGLVGRVGHGLAGSEWPLWSEEWVLSPADPPSLVVEPPHLSCRPPSWRRWRGHWGRGHPCDPPPRPRLWPRRCPVSRALGSAASLFPGSCRRAAVDPHPGAAPVPEALLSPVLVRGHLAVPPRGRQGRICFPGPQALGRCSRFSGPGGVGREGQGAGPPRIRLAVAAPRPCGRACRDREMGGVPVPRSPGPGLSVSAWLE